MTGGTGSLASPAVMLVAAPALLELTDRVLPDGRVVVRSSLIEAGSASLYNDQGDGTIIDGDFVPELIGADVIISRVLVTTNGQLRLNRVGSTNIETLFTTGAYADALTHVQVERDSALSFAASDIDAATSSAVRLRYNLTAAELAIIDGIADGQRWILTFTQPEPAVVLSVELPGITGGTGALASPAVTTIAAAVSTVVVELPALTGGVGSLTAPAVTLVPPPVIPVEIPPLTGGTGSLAAPTITLVTPPALSVELPPLTGGTGTLAAPAITLVTPPVLPVQIPALTGAAGSLAPLAVTLNTAAVLTVEIPTLTGGVGSLAAPAVTLVPPLLTLPDIAIPAGRRLVGTTEGSLLASVADVVADIFGVMYIAGDTVLAGDDPVDLGDTGLSVVRILQTSNNQLRINENGAGDFLALYSAGGTYAARQFHVQVDTATVVTVTAADIDAGTSTADRLRWNLTATQQTELQSLDLGSRFIHFITEPDTAAVLAVELPGLTGGVGSLASLAVQVVTPPVLAVEIPAITGGTGSLAAPEVTLFDVQPEIIAILVQLPTITGGSGSLAAIAVTVVTPSITTIVVRIPAITGGTGTIASPAVTVVTGTTPVTPVTPGADGSVEILEADRSAVVVLPDGGTSLSRIVKSFEVTELLTAYGRQESVSHLFLSGFSPVVTADPPVLTRRRIVRVSRTGQVPEEWRISQSVRHVDGLADAQLQLEPLWMDLSGRISKRVTGQVQRVDWTLVGRTPAEALAAILDDAPGFVAGTVDAAFAGASVALHALVSTHLDLLRQLCDAVTAAAGVRCEWDVVPSAGDYTVNLVRAVGGTIVHPVEGPVGGSNRRALTVTRDATRYFSRVVALSGPDGETGTLAGARWLVASQSGTAVVLEGDPVYVGSAIVPDGELYLAQEGVREAVVSLVVPRTVVLGAATGFTSGEPAWFETAVSGGFAGLAHVADYAAEAVTGVKDRPLRRPDIPPWPNLLDDAEVSADLSEFVGGMPRGVITSDVSVTVTRETDARYVQFGAAAARVEADAGSYIETTDIDLSGEGYTSFWLFARVLSGRFRMSLVSSADPNNADFPAGVVYPRGEQLTGAADIVFRGPRRRRPRSAARPVPPAAGVDRGRHGAHSRRVDGDALDGTAGVCARHGTRGALAGRGVPARDGGGSPAGAGAGCVGGPEPYGRHGGPACDRCVRPRP